MLICEREPNLRLVPFSEALKSVGIAVSPTQVDLAEKTICAFSDFCMPDSLALAGAAAKNLCFGVSKVGLGLPPYFKKIEEEVLRGGNFKGISEEDRKIISQVREREAMDVDIKFSPQGYDFPKFLRELASSCRAKLSFKGEQGLIEGDNFIIEVRKGSVRVRRETEPASRIVISIKDKKGGSPLTLDLTEYPSTGPDYRGGREAPLSDLIRLPLKVYGEGSAMLEIPPLDESDRGEIVVSPPVNLATLLRAFRNAVFWDLSLGEPLVLASLKDSYAEKLIPPERRKDAFNYLLALTLSSPAIISLLGVCPRTDLFRFFPLKEKLEIMPRLDFLRNLRLPSGDPLFPEAFIREMTTFSETPFRASEIEAQGAALKALLEKALEIDRQHREELLKPGAPLEKSGLGMVFSGLCPRASFLSGVPAFLSSLIPYKYPEFSSSSYYNLNSSLAREVLGEATVEELIRRAAAIGQKMLEGRERFSAWLIRQGGSVYLMEVYVFYKRRESPVVTIDENPPLTTIDRLTRGERVISLC